jgi:NhaP-type Na+/H+ or K+/H+ antiporter
MLLILLFALALLVAAFLSSLAQRTVLSTAVLFLVVGFAAGMTPLIDVAPDNPLVSRFAEVALCTILFVDGLRLGTSSQRGAWRLPGRVLFAGLPLTLLLTAGLAHLVMGTPWADAFLIAAALSPTDPVFAVALIRHSAVPERLRHLLNVESGVNDGLALPLVLGLLAVRGSAEATLAAALGDVAAGVALGAGIVWAAVQMRRISFLEVSDEYAPIGSFAIGLLVFAAASLLGSNEFLATFVAAVTLGVKVPRAARAFHPFGEPLSEIAKLAALLFFGATLAASHLFESMTVAMVVFAALTLIVARPLGVLISLTRSELSRREAAAAAWFGPKGFASVFFALMIFKSGVADAATTFDALATTIALSMIAHASTDVVVARWFLAADEAAPA